MTVQELIDELQKVQNKNLKVVIRGTDPTDWTYNNDIEDLEEANVFYDELNGYRRRFVIDAGCF